MTNKQIVIKKPTFKAIGLSGITHSVEYFHIYTDETIDKRHLKSLAYLRKMSKTWEFNYSRVILIDNYNPTEHNIGSDEILKFLTDQKLAPDYWAFEADMTKDADLLLNVLTNNKLKRNYISYIEKHKKYPCSLLTAVWYLKRLGYFKNNGAIKPYMSKKEYTPVKYLLNVLPQDYNQTEARAFKLIKHSPYADAIFKVQDIFYPIDSGRARDFF